MRSIPLFATLMFLAAAPGVHAKSELELLRERCAAQQQELGKLKGVSASKPVTASAKVAAKPSKSATSGTYVVKAGDSVERIARKSGVSQTALVQTNGLKTNAIIHPGQTLKLPGRAAASPKTQMIGATKPAATQTPAAVSKKPAASTDIVVADKAVAKPQPARPASITPRASGMTMISAPAPKSKEPVAIAKTEAPAKSASRETISTGAPEPSAGDEGEAVSRSEKSSPPAEASTPHTEKPVQPVMIDNEMTYGEFAARHGTDVTRLNTLNGLDLATATVLAKGSELYVPAQP